MSSCLECTPNFAYALFECVRTVLSVMNKRSAMVFLLRPRAISTAIYASLSVKP